MNYQTTSTLHPAWSMPFAELISGLDEAWLQGAAYSRTNNDGLQLWNYTDRCVYEKMWTPITISARGLIVDPANQKIVATPFPKFFNLGERPDAVPSTPFEVFEKVDGSLIIIFFHNEKWQTTTRGAFGTEQAKWAEKKLESLNLAALEIGTTYLAEAVYAENRIVVSYDEPQLVLLSAYNNKGQELNGSDVDDVASRLRTRAAKRYQFESMSQILEAASSLPRSEEGYVLRFESGHRLKVKGAEYRRIHALISRVTPLAIWEMILNRDDLNSIRRDIPEEYWRDFDDIRAIFEARSNALIDKIAAFAKMTAKLSDKEIGLQVNSFDPEIRKFIFAFRKSGISFLDIARNREAFWRNLRPTANELEGYVPSNALERIMQEG